MSNYVQQAEGTGATSAVTTGTGGAGFGSNVTSGNVLYIVVSCKGSTSSNTTAFAVTGSATIGSATLISATTDYATINRQLLQYWIPITGSGTCALKATITGMPTAEAIFAAELSGLASTPFTTGEYGQSTYYGTGVGGNDTSTTGSLPSGGGSLSESNGVLVGFCYVTQNNANATAGTIHSYTSTTGVWAGLGSACGLFEYATLSSSANTSCTFTPPLFNNTYTVGAVFAVASSTNVTVNLTGVAGTGSVGTLTPATALPLTGNAGTGSIGTLKPASSVPLTGVVGTGSPGTLTPALSLPLTGIVGTGSPGTLIPATALALTGVTGTGSVGTLAPSTAVPLTGIVGTGALGNITTGNDVTVTLSGVSATGSLGTLAPALSLPLTGTVGTGALGTLVSALSLSLTGAAATGALGALSTGLAVPLLGNAGTGALGTLVASTTGNVTVALTGVQGTGFVGTLIASGGSGSGVIPPQINMGASFGTALGRL